MPQSRSILPLLLIGALFALITAICLPSGATIAALSPNILRNTFSRVTTKLGLATSNAKHLQANLRTAGNIATNNMTRTPVYFLSHGGPNLFEDYSHPAYSKLQTIGREITTQVKPKAVVVFSAHWQADPTIVQVNTATSQKLIYDYYGFPDHYYTVQYPNAGSPELASRVLDALRGAGINAEGVQRGLDHGVFAPFLVAFDPVKNPLGVPVVQVSLFDSDDAARHIALGKALAPLREEGVLIVCSGMAVHNLRDLWGSMGKPRAMPYAYSFDEALKEAVEQGDEEARGKAMVGLLQRSDARRAHPSFEHLLPVHVAAGAAGGDRGKQLWTLPEGSMSWAQFRFGDVAAGGQ